MSFAQPLAVSCARDVLPVVLTQERAAASYAIRKLFRVPKAGGFDVRTLITLVSLVTLLIATNVAAQESTAELRGRVLDAQGSAVPGVTIVITNQATGVYREVVSNGDGTYFATALAPGTYSFAAELTGFKKYMRSDIR